MGIKDLYSKRKKLAERGNQPDVYQYTNLPIEFRRQVIFIWRTAIGSYRVEAFAYEPPVNRWWRIIHDSLAKELGWFNLGNDFHDPFEQCKSFLLNNDTSVEHHLDLIELTFRHIDEDIREFLRNHPSRELSTLQPPDDAISELNHRFREHAIGYQYNNGQIIRVDSGFIHTEVVVSALSLLSSQDFKGAEQEFRSAHEHYRKKEYKQAIVNALNAFESTMKTICDKCGWSYSDKNNAKDLIGIVLENELVPKYLQNHLSALRSVLEGGVPTVRNKTSGHGQGIQPITVPEYLAAYVLHLTASNIVFLVEAYKAKQGNLE
ncbi:STM4504/CBY_0614 family protein [Microcoleus sp. Pol12B4]|uniref:STM4504/CBY_0614 family protein n=1 Tax=Microcoleus sp. Pol12B4 TaxID=3055395 RepID=UPI002FD32B45